MIQSTPTIFHKSHIVILAMFVFALFVGIGILQDPTQNTPARIHAMYGISTDLMAITFFTSAFGFLIALVRRCNRDIFVVACLPILVYFTMTVVALFSGGTLLSVGVLGSFILLLWHEIVTWQATT